MSRKIVVFLCKSTRSFSLAYYADHTKTNTRTIGMVRYQSFRASGVLDRSPAIWWGGLSRNPVFLTQRKAESKQRTAEFIDKSDRQGAFSYQVLSRNPVFLTQIKAESKQRTAEIIDKSERQGAFSYQVLTRNPVFSSVSLSLCFIKSFPCCPFCPFSPFSPLLRNSYDH
jgi:hypothetical protein